MAKSDTARARFEEALARTTWIRDTVVPFFLNFLDNPPAGKRSPITFRELLPSGVDDILGVGGSLERIFVVEANSPLARVFEKSNLNPKDPFAWKTLLTLFAEAHFPKPRQRGRKIEWTEERLCQLLSDYDEIKNRRSVTNDTDGRILKDVKAYFPHRYCGAVETLRRKLYDARDPDKNKRVVVD
jgi:hypothetical protein